MAGDQTGGYAAEQGRREDAIRSANALGAAAAGQGSGMQSVSRSSTDDGHNSSILGSMDQTSGDSLQRSEVFLSSTAHGFLGNRGKSSHWLLWWVVATVVLAGIYVASMSSLVEWLSAGPLLRFVTSVVGLIVALPFATGLVKFVFETTRPNASGLRRLVSSVARWIWGICLWLVLVGCIAGMFFNSAGGIAQETMFMHYSLFGLFDNPSPFVQQWGGLVVVLVGGSFFARLFYIAIR